MQFINFSRTIDPVEYWFFQSFFIESKSFLSLLSPTSLLYISTFTIFSLSLFFQLGFPFDSKERRTLIRDYRFRKKEGKIYWDYQRLLLKWKIKRRCTRCGLYNRHDLLGFHCRSLFLPFIYSLSLPLSGFPWEIIIKAWKNFLFPRNKEQLHFNLFHGQ